MGRFKIFSLHKRLIMAPDVSHSNEWNLDNNGLQFRIRSIFWGYAARTYTAADPTRGEWLPNDANTLKFQLRLGDGTALIHSIFNEASMSHAMSIPPASNDFNGKRMYLWKPGQYVFNSWDIENSIQLAVDVYSCDFVESYLAFYDVAVEIEEK